MKIRTALKAGGWHNHNETLAVRTALKGGRVAGPIGTNHNESLQTRTGLKAGKLRRAVQVTSRKEDRLELLVVRAGLRAGLRAFRARR